MKFNIITLGCKVNTYESNYISQSLIDQGFLLCENISDSDVIIINTCTVTDTSDKKSLKMVRRVRRENPSAILVVCGCSAQNNPEVYQKLDINILIGNKEKSKVCEKILEYVKSENNYCYITPERNIPFEDMEITHFDQVRAYIKVQDGCNNFCSYCIIPFVRGSLRCKKFEKVLSECETLAQNGYQEIVLTGIHTGSYNDEGKDLVCLINAITKIDGVKRVRLSSVEITELNDKFLNMLKENYVFCDHLHVPLQSGCDEILKVMNRKYDTAFYENKIKEIRSIRPNISITTDLIVGHNFETDELFNETYEFCQKINFAKIHVFPFSKREGTASSKMSGAVDEKVKKERARKMIELSDKLEKEYYNQFIGRKLDVLIEENKDGYSIGHTANYLRVKLPEVLEVNKIYSKEIK